MDNIEERRLTIFKSPLNYLETFKDQEKVLFIGTGLAYDDLVKDSKPQFLENIDVSPYKNRTQYYPKNAYLIDLDGKFYYDNKIFSYSDLQADITKEIGVDGGLPKEFIGQFDHIILEYLTFSSLTGKAFKNLWKLLGKNGEINTQIISDVMFDVKIEPSNTRDYQTYGLADSKDNALAVSCWHYDWVDNENESLIEEYLYTVFPTNSKESLEYKSLNRELGIISYEKLDELYKDNEYKEDIITQTFNVYKHNITQYFIKLLQIKEEQILFSNVNSLWVTQTPEKGYFVVSKN